MYEMGQTWVDFYKSSGTVAVMVQHRDKHMTSPNSLQMHMLRLISYAFTIVSVRANFRFLTQTRFEKKARD